MCRECGKAFSGGPRAFYCPACRIERERARRRIRNAKGFKSVRPLGSTDKCEVCGKDYTVNGGLQKYCPVCAPEQIKAIDRVQGLNYYAGNREDINLYRFMTRYHVASCAVCGKTYKTKTKQLTCSRECHRVYVNKKWMERYHKKRGADKDD